MTMGTSSFDHDDDFALAVALAGISASSSMLPTMSGALPTRSSGGGTL
jgi:hypothetical protein